MILFFLELKPCYHALSLNKAFSLKPQPAQAHYESLIINTCNLKLCNPQSGREHKGFEWEFR